MMTQEDGFIEVKTNLFNKTPIIKRIIPVVIRRVPLLFDVYCMVIISRESDLAFTEISEMTIEEYLTWFVYGGYKSYLSLKNKRANITIEKAQEWVRGILASDRDRILDTIQKSREIGEIADSYQKARNKDPEGEADGLKKVQAQGSEQQS